jgi:7-carboxy-7-deazaguanine synthase
MHDLPKRARLLRVRPDRFWIFSAQRPPGKHGFKKAHKKHRWHTRRRFRGIHWVWIKKSVSVTYAVKEIFLTLQGEGAHSGRPAVFCRFAGCNLWSGREEDRADAECQFCDTDFLGTDGTSGGRYQSADELADTIANQWGSALDRRFVVMTGGEPLLQLDRNLIDALHAREFIIAVETNGTLDPPAGLDWICVSPKANTVLRIKSGHELKLVFPQAHAPPENFVELSFERFSLQPMDGPDLAQNTARAVAYCLEHPRWQLSLQTHKALGIR